MLKSKKIALFNLWVEFTIRVRFGSLIINTALIIKTYKNYVTCLLFGEED